MDISNIESANRCRCKEQQENSSCSNLAIASVPFQNASWENIYSLDDALSRGTLFPELDLPFLCGGAKC